MSLKQEAKILIGLILALYIIILILAFFEPFNNPLQLLIRLFALFGLTSMFIATIMTSFMVKLYKLFGKPFIKIHHLFSISGIILISLHPVFFAIDISSTAVFIPKFDSWLIFWELAGRPALYLIYIAIIAGILNSKYKKIPKYWRYIHGLNYIALFFGVIHGILIGTDFQNPIILIIFISMLVLSYGTLLFKRYQKYQRLKNKKVSQQ